MEFNIFDYLRLKDKGRILRSQVRLDKSIYIKFFTIYSTTWEVVIALVCLLLRDLFAGDDFWTYFCESYTLTSVVD